ncbi:class I SAM-dependent methyltransferase [Paenibacillus sp. N3/727]|uniref:class I SAM-dependent methyltransferase n=1 Tax=Paenibacillus sp. N3/727 TaxID=2925845 RepID=UPI001F52CD6B|nr:class I SAM-dependent methyltransferase [Paenibacillus sp. N3/727]UNK20702.1 class I SAM-dependent methyltransferase [Paenibacillus sp. N3/727]
MFTLSNFQDAIEKQLLHNQNKSLFYELPTGRLLLNPSKETTDLFKQRAKDIANFIQFSCLDGTYQQLIKYISDKTIKLFMEVNQYLDFSRQDYRQLQKIYRDLFDQICFVGNKEEISEREISSLFISHYKNLQIFLLESNGTKIFKKYRENPNLFEIKCAEYSPEFQMKLLNINLKTIKQPILDVGCGPQASLVHFLRENGIEAFGVDRNVNIMNYLYKMNWTECTFTSNTWGTVISHMAFSNHFTHHHLRTDGEFEIYATKYMEILHSLKIGGSFIYTPSLSFIEELLKQSNKSFVVETREHSTEVKRIK